MNQTSSYQIVNEDALSSGMEDDDSSSDHHGTSYDEHHFRQETENTCNSHTHSNIGEIQRGWTYEDQFKEVSCKMCITDVSIIILTATYTLSFVSSIPMEFNSYWLCLCMPVGFSDKLIMK